jgi:hypothetical protein
VKKKNAPKLSWQAKMVHITHTDPEDKATKPGVPDMLRESAATYEERNKVYGDNYKRFGHTMLTLFPEGITLSTADDFNRFCLLLMNIHKISRYTKSFKSGGHDDSLLDISVYATMLREVDKEAKG